MILFPNAKINLGLFVERRRPDGYHDLQSVFYPVNWCDVIEFKRSKRFEMFAHGIPIDSGTEQNLIYKAWRVLNLKYKIDPIELHLLKNIPMGAGLGGGSADAAFSLLGLNEEFELGLSEQELESIALEIGSDCPFFIQNKPSLISGRGEKMEQIELDLSGKSMVLIHPGIHSGTREAYAGIRLEPEHFDLKELASTDLTEWKTKLSNSFERTIFKIYPQIAEIKERLYDKGAQYASMSGSGSAVYGLFDEVPEVQEFEAFENFRIIEL